MNSNAFIPVSKGDLLIHHRHTNLRCEFIIDHDVGLSIYVFNDGKLIIQNYRVLGYNVYHHDLQLYNMIVRCA
jgi:hypothetical protein